MASAIARPRKYWTRRSARCRAGWSGDVRNYWRCWAKVVEMNDDELCFAWLDGELKGEEAERYAARVAADPALQARAEQHRRAETQLRGAFDSVIEQDVA